MSSSVSSPWAIPSSRSNALRRRSREGRSGGNSFSNTSLTVLADPAKIEADALTRLSAIHREVSVVRGLGRLPMRVATEEFEREYLIELVKSAGRSVAAAAQIAQVHPKSLERLLRKHGLKARDL